MQVRVAEDVHVAGTPVRRRGNVQQGDPGVGRDVARAPLQDPVVPRPVQEGGSPELQVQPGGDEEVRPTQVQGEARLGPHEVRVLVGIRDGGGVHLRPPDVAGELGVDGEGGHHPDRGGLGGLQIGGRRGARAGKGLGSGHQGHQDEGEGGRHQ